MSIENTNALLRQKETELDDINYKLANQQNAMASLITINHNSGHGLMNLTTRPWNRKR